MEHSNPADLEPIFDGIPVLVRLINGDDVICVLYQHRNEDDSRMFMERPLRLVMDELQAEPAQDPAAKKSKVLYSKVRTRFDRWMPMTVATMFPIYGDHMLSIAPIADQYIHPYMEWANQLYEYVAEPSYDAQPTTEQQQRAAEEDLKQSYIDFFLHNFNPKGKPN